MSKSIGKNIIFKTILNLFNIVIPIIIGPYVYRKLGDTLNGYITFTDSIYQYFFIFASFGIYQYGIREISRVRDNKEKLESVFTSLFTITMITNIVSTIVYIIFVNFRYSEEVFYSACMVTTFNFIANAFYVEWVNEGLENYDFITIKTIIVRLIYTILILLILKSSDNYMEYLIILVVTNIINNLLSFIYIKSKIRFRFNKILIKNHIKPMLLVVILSNANVLYTQLDKFMLGELVNMDSVSYYGLAQKIITIVTSFMLTIVQVTIPRLSNYLSKNKDDDYLELLDKITKVYFIFLFPAAIGMLSLSSEIVRMYGGEQFIYAAPILSVFSIYMITVAYENIISNQVMYINGREKDQVRMVFFAGIVNLLLNLLLVRIGLFNATNAIITTTIANSILILVEYIYVKRKLKIDIKLFSIDKLKYAIISLLFIPITYALRYVIEGTILYIVISIISCGLIYISILVLIKDKQLNLIKNIILRKIKKI